MNDEPRFRAMANECRAQAAILTDPATSAQWRRIAHEYDKLADTAAEIERLRLKQS
jgi:hypothetical protein